MSLAALQIALARVLTDATLREDFLAERGSALWQLDMSVETAAALGKIDPRAVRNFASCLQQKRTQDARKVLPLTAQVLGGEFDRLSGAAIQGPPRPGRHHADAVALVRYLCDSSVRAPIQPAWIKDLARFEIAFVSAGTTGACCMLRYFRFPVAAIARAVLSGKTPERVVPRPSVGLWLRPGKTKRLMHVCWRVSPRPSAPGRSPSDS